MQVRCAPDLQRRAGTVAGRGNNGLRFARMPLDSLQGVSVWRGPRNEVSQVERPGDRGAALERVAQDVASGLRDIPKKTDAG